jgi:hypothetical protein
MYWLIVAKHLFPCYWTGKQIKKREKKKERKRERNSKYDFFQNSFYRFKNKMIFSRNPPTFHALLNQHILSL